MVGLEMALMAFEFAWLGHNQINAWFSTAPNLSMRLCFTGFLGPCMLQRQRL